jgi:hypothetical protein
MTLEPDVAALCDGGHIVHLTTLRALGAGRGVASRAHLKPFGAPSARTLSRSERTALPCLSPLLSL